MKRIVITLLLGLFAGVLSAQQVGGVQVIDHCDLAATKLKAKNGLSPYKTLYSKNYRIAYKTHDQIREFKINLLGYQAYRLVFNTEGLPLDVKILVTDRERTHKKAVTLLETNTKDIVTLDLGDEDDQYDPGKVYVTLFIPGVEDVDPAVREKGCINFIYGTKVTEDDRNL